MTPFTVIGTTSGDVTVPARMSLFGHCAAVLGDVWLRTALILALVMAPVLAVRAMTAAAAFFLDTLGRQ
jgi:hypothetical protein